MSKFMNPNELRKITEDLALEKMKAEAALKLNAEKVAGDIKKDFESRELSPMVAERINNSVRSAAERGEKEILVLQFPSSLCSDGGRRINNYEEDWPSSLQGFGKKAFDFYVEELKPLGFTLRAAIMSYPGGMPGDVGLYLRW